jgi:hypothetical protein
MLHLFGIVGRHRYLLTSVERAGSILAACEYFLFLSNAKHSSVGANNNLLLNLSALNEILYICLCVSRSFI